MKRLFGCLVLVTLGFVKVETSEKLLFTTEKSKTFAAQAQGVRFLMTFPRSGTNLVACYLQALTHCPVSFMFKNASQDKISENLLQLEIDYEKPILYRTHHGKRDLKYFNSTNNKLLMVLRNYKECIPRENMARNLNAGRGMPPLEDPAFLKTLFDHSKDFDHYIGNLEFFHSWEPAQRLLIYYEDLLSNPLEEVTKIFQFFNEPIPEQLTKETLEEIKNQTLASYHNHHHAAGGSLTKGQDMEYHTKKIPPELIVEIDERMEHAYPVLWGRYLMRYKTTQ